MTINLKTRTAVVTGAAGGIGRALVLEAARRGMNVSIADVDEQGLGQTVELVRPSGAQVLQTRVDVSRRDEVAALARRTFETFTSVAVVFANAGVLRTGSTVRPDLDAWDLMIDVNMRGTSNTISAFISRMVKQDEPSRFVITGSQASLLASRDLGAYTATKHALWAVAETLKTELEAEGANVGVSLLCPGAVRTGIADRRDGTDGTEVEAAMRRRLVEVGMAPEKVAQIAFDAVLAGRFWIFTHTEFKASLERRFGRVLSESDPEPWDRRS
jgi:NAD(P)-dependent dehydrogenase (short-subunit alcohol dehydrogenase family)